MSVRWRFSVSLEPVVNGSPLDPTTEADPLHKHLNFNGRYCTIAVRDTAAAGPEEHLHERYMRQQEGFLLVYSIACRSSFEEVVDFYHGIVRARASTSSGNDLDRGAPPPPPSMVIVGSKCDLEELRVVSTKEGAELAASLGCSFLEASAKTRFNVEEVFRELARQVIAVNAHKRKKTKKKSGCLVS